MRPYQILEIANTHGGSIEYLLSLIDEFKDFNGYGVKFQPLKPDRIATKDFAWYSVYEELFFDLEEWRTIIDRANQTKEIWLDIFDTYGVEVFNLNRDKTKGIKLQASILYNEAVLSELEHVKADKHFLIINVSGLEIEQIRERLTSIQNKLNPLEIWIEVGFQAYPTELADCGYVKIDILKKEFSNKIVFADHADGKSDDAIWLPIFAVMNGADVVEKHILHSALETKYDHYSSIDYKKYGIFIQKLQSYIELRGKPFINSREEHYLATGIQIPISKKNIPSGSLLSLKEDLDFKRSGKAGLNTLEIKELQKSMHILSKSVDAQETFRLEDFKKANIATIVACRLKSTRLSKKALLKIGNLTSVERCIQSCLNFSDVNYTILATSDLESDSELESYKYDSSVIFHKGDPEDVIRRYLGIANALKIDVIVRITADMPFVSREIVDILLKSHFETGADYTTSVTAAVGTSTEIINVSALNTIKDYFPNAEYSEYMTWYFQNNPEHFKLNFVNLPENLIRDYRLTLDYQEDLDMFNEIQAYRDKNNSQGSLSDLFKFLDSHPEIASINSHLTLKYKTDPVLIETLNRATKII